ncbi:MAG: amidohydrolase family protein, partial [Candidatus Bathyarchaeia archaeon]
MMRSKLRDFAKLLVDTALGRIKADLVIKDGDLVDVNSGEILEEFDIAIKKDRIALIGDVDHTIGAETMVIDARGKYIAPGFIDAHLHVESSMMNLTEFARTVLLRG